MALTNSLDTIFSQQMLMTVFALVALGLGLIFSFGQGNVIITGFMGIFTVLVGILLINQIRTSLREAKYT